MSPHFKLQKFHARTIKFHKNVLLNQAILKKSTRIGLDLVIKSIKLMMVLKTNKHFFKFTVKQKSLINVQNNFSKHNTQKIPSSTKKNWTRKRESQILTHHNLIESTKMKSHISR